MASKARPSICEARGDRLPRFARRDGIFGLLFKVCVRYPDGFGKLAMTNILDLAQPQYPVLNSAASQPRRLFKKATSST
jgi:hypothetical protein